MSRRRFRLNNIPHVGIIEINSSFEDAVEDAVDTPAPAAEVAAAEVPAAEVAAAEVAAAEVLAPTPAENAPEDTPALAPEEAVR